MINTIMKVTKYSFLLVMVSLISCLGEDPVLDDEICTHDIGQQQLTAISKEAFPYTNIKNVTFVDSFGIKKIFDLKFTSSSSKVTNSIAVKDTIFNGVPYPAGTITNCMLSQAWSYTLTEIGGSLILVGRVQNDFDATLPQRNVVDEVEILISSNNRPLEVFPYFNIRLDYRNSQDGFVNKIKTIDDLTIFGKTFSGVMYNEFATVQQHKAYYNKTEGIVMFSEANGRIWRFDSMQ